MCSSDLIYPGGPALPTGDDLHVFHKRNERVAMVGGRTASATRLRDWFDAGPVTLVDGAPATISGAFVPTPMNRSLPAQGLDRSRYDVGIDPNAAQLTYELGVVASPFATTVGGGNAIAWVAFDDWSRSTALTASVVVPYADPFPASWARILLDQLVTFRNFRVPGATSSMFINGGYWRVRPLPVAPPDLAPGLTPPSDVRIAGVDAMPGGRLPLDGVQPIEVRWSASPGATQYTVQVYQLSLNGTRTKRTMLARLTTTATSIAIPADALAGATFVAFNLTATQSLNAYASGELFENGLPQTSATVTAGMFRLSATCGDGQVDPGEGCDTTTASATCDADCTPVLCGDGLANTAAGEACDTDADTPTCDRDCTPAVCGDGHRNRTREDCDDGDAVDSGNGCSAACKFNNVCGDGVLQATVEECDGAGDTALCDADCTFAECGDGYRNATAGEQCDYELANGVGSPCSYACQLQ